MRKKLEDIFGLDIRALAVLRVLLGLIILADILIRIQDVTAFYTDQGVLPRSILTHYFPHVWSFHLLSGSWKFQVFLFFCQAIFAFTLMLGYRTKLSLVMSWLLLLSLHNRNFMLLQGGDSVLRLLLFWSLFLPLGHYFSVDRLRLKLDKYPKNKTVFSLGTVAFILQMCLIYWSAGLFKWNPVWLSGEAVSFALQIDRFVRPFGILLAKSETLMTILTFLTLYFEVFGPFLLLMPFKTSVFRNIGVTLFIIMHIGFDLSLNVGLFSIIMIIGWIPIYAKSFWDWMAGLMMNKGNFTLIAKKNTLKYAQFWTALFLHIPKKVTLSSSNIDSWQIYINNKRIVGYDRILFLVEESKIFFWTLPFFKGFRFLFNQLLNLKVDAEKKPFMLPKTMTSFSAAFFLVFVSLLNFQALYPRAIKSPTFQAIRSNLSILELNQGWKMFCIPPQTSTWHSAVATLDNDHRIDLLRKGKRYNAQIPKNTREIYPNYRWRKYFENISMPTKQHMRKYYVNYLLRTSRAIFQKTGNLKEFNLFFHEKSNKEPKKNSKRLLWKFIKEGAVQEANPKNNRR